MSITHWLASGSVIVCSLFPLQSSLAITTTGTQVANFTSGVETRLVIHHNRLFSFTEMQDGTVEAAVANKTGEEWTVLASNQPPLVRVLENTTQIDKFALFKNAVFMATRNDAGETQIWNMCLACRPGAWKKSGDASFGDAANTKIIDLFRSNGSLLALTEHASGNSLFSTENGKTWTQIGVAGLGLGITDAIGLSGRIADDNNTVYVASSSGTIYSADKSDLTTWTVVTTIDGTITALAGKYTAIVNSDNVAQVFETADGLTYTQVGEDGLGNANNSEVDRFFRVGDNHFAVTKNATDGAEMRRWSEDDNAWVLVTEAGFGDANNSSVRSLLHYHGHQFATVNNSVDGPSIYKLDHAE